MHLEYRLAGLESRQCEFHNGSFGKAGDASKHAIVTLSLKIHIQSCLLCIAFHPEIPSLIAGGAFNGNGT